MGEEEKKSPLATCAYRHMATVPIGRSSPGCDVSGTLLPNAQKKHSGGKVSASDSQYWWSRIKS